MVRSDIRAFLKLEPAGGLFLGTFAFEDHPADYGVAIRLGGLVGSLVAAALGYAILRRTLPPAGSGPGPHRP